MFNVPLPPPEYSGPYAGQVIEYMLPLAQVRELCGGGPFVLACADPGRERCVIVLPEVRSPITNAIQSRLRAHELGHCNGWPAHHPNPRF